MAHNAPLTNYALMHALPRIAEQPADQGFFTEALMAGIARARPRPRSACATSSKAGPPRCKKSLSSPTTGTSETAPCPLPPAAPSACRASALREGAPGVRYLQADRAAAATTRERMTDRLVHWAEAAPDRIFMARREQLPDGSTGDWQHLSYARGAATARAASARPCSTAA